MSVSASGADRPAEPADQAGHDGGSGGHQASRGMIASVWILEHAQDLITVVIGVVLLFLAGALLVSGIVEFVHQESTLGIATAAQGLLDQALFALILIEIVHTVVLSLQSHRLIAQPFVVVGLVAVIRRILLLLSAPKPPKPAELALLIAMVAVFVGGLIAISKFEGHGGSEKDQI